jgi:hypothetical protein
MTRAAFENDTFFREGDVTFAAFEPQARSTTVEITG